MLRLWWPLCLRCGQPSTSSSSSPAPTKCQRLTTSETIWAIKRTYPCITEFDDGLYQSEQTLSTRSWCCSCCTCSCANLVNVVSAQVGVREYTTFVLFNRQWQYSRAFAWYQWGCFRVEMALNWCYYGPIWCYIQSVDARSYVVAPTLRDIISNMSC